MPEPEHVPGNEGVGGHVCIDCLPDLTSAIEGGGVRHPRHRPREPAAMKQAEGHGGHDEGQPGEVAYPHGLEGR